MWEARRGGKDGTRLVGMVVEGYKEGGERIGEVASGERRFVVRRVWREQQVGKPQSSGEGC